MSSAREVACPKCGMGAGQKCRTLKTNRSTDDHVDRWAKWWEFAQLRRQRYQR